jgi:general secretion pathway protein D
MTSTTRPGLSIRGALLATLLLVALLPALLPTAARAADEPVSLNFVNAEIDSVVRAISKITGRNFVIDPRVRGTINIVSNRPVSPSLAYDILLSALRVHGFTSTEANGVTLIVPEADAKLHYTPAADSGRARAEQLVTEVLPLEYESASLLLPVLRPLVSPNNSISAYAANNTIVVTDYLENVRKIRAIVAAVDQANSPEPEAFRLKHASVIDLLPMINRLLGESQMPLPGAANSDGQRRTAMVPDLRTNTLYVQASSRARLERVRQLIALLDVASPSGAVGGSMHVVYLRNAEATRLAKTLRAIWERDAGASAATTSSSATTAQRSGSTAADAEAATPGIIQADAATNSLIITAPEPTYQELRAIIDKLDTRRAQVYVEALIAEVSAERATEFGVQWNALSGLADNSTRVVGGTNFTARPGGSNVLDVATNPVTAGRGLNIGVVKGTITIPGVADPIVNLGALARALETDGRTNILSTPNLLTLDGEEAKIIVGQNVPFITGSYAQTGSGTTPTPFQTIERKDVGLTLRVKPQITEGGAVRMAVFQEVSSVSNDASTAGLITNKRSIESNVIVDDGDFIVIGGLIQDSLVVTRDQVPFLGSIPLLGLLFRYDRETRLKTNLMVFLRPVVVRAGDGAHELTADRYDYLIGEQSQLDAPQVQMLVEPPQLPPRDATTGVPPSPAVMPGAAATAPVASPAAAAGEGAEPPAAGTPQ